MIIFYLIILLAFFPIVGFLLARESSNKVFVFSCSFIVLGLALFSFTSKFSILGSVHELMLSDEIKVAVYENTELEDEYFNDFILSIDDDKKILWLEEIILFAINNNSLIAAEQLVEFAQPIYIDADLQIRFFALYSILRDKKFPDFAFSSINTSFTIPKKCNFVSIRFTAFIKMIDEMSEVRDVPIAQQLYKDPSTLNILLTNEDALIPGIDLASALINDEDIFLNGLVNCQNSMSFSSSTFPKKISTNKALLSAKISEKDWFVNAQ